MVTDTERREVAQNMRDGVKSKAEYELLSLNGSSAAIRWLISYVVFGDKKYHSGVDLMNRLADLIEPDTTSDTTKSAEDTTKAPTSSDTASTSSGAAPTHTDAAATCDVSQSRRDTVACNPTGRGIDSIYEWCFERLEGADGAEDELYCSIMRAIEDYRHPELANAHTVRPADREALLALADEMEEEGVGRFSTTVRGGWLVDSAYRIREALGVVEE
jgi:hypothetical protein